MRACLCLLLLGACGAEEASEGRPSVPLEGIQPFVVPDVSEVDLPSAYADALVTLMGVTTQAPWAGHTAALETRQLGCPDLWIGGTEDAMSTADAGGVSWSDDCRTAGGLYYNGWMWWDTQVSASGDATTPEGRTTEASRVLEGDALVGVDSGVRVEFKGHADDYSYRVEADGYSRWVYRTTVEGTVTGSDIFEGSLTPRGWRTDVYLNLTGGDVDRLEARGNVYMFEPQIAGRFDSIAVDMEVVGVLGAGPRDCTLEPTGWIGLRDEDAVWYDLVFLPRNSESIVEQEYPNDPLSICDGCGTLYVRGLEVQEVCVDLTTVFNGLLEQPPLEDYVLTLHDL